MPQSHSSDMFVLFKPFTYLMKLIQYILWPCPILDFNVFLPFYSLRKTMLDMDLLNITFIKLKYDSSGQNFFKISIMIEW